MTHFKQFFDLTANKFGTEQDIVSRTITDNTYNSNNNIYLIKRQYVKKSHGKVR